MAKSAKLTVSGLTQPLTLHLRTGKNMPDVTATKFVPGKTYDVNEEVVSLFTENPALRAFVEEGFVKFEGAGELDKCYGKKREAYNARLERLSMEQDERKEEKPAEDVSALTAENTKLRDELVSTNERLEKLEAAMAKSEVPEGTAPATSAAKPPAAPPAAPAKKAGA